MLSRRIDRLEASAGTATPRVWFEDIDTGELVCRQSGERVPVDGAGRLGTGDIVVRYVRDWRGHGPEA